MELAIARAESNLHAFVSWLMAHKDNRALFRMAEPELYARLRKVLDLT